MLDASNRYSIISILALAGTTNFARKLHSTNHLLRLIIRHEFKLHHYVFDISQLIANILSMGFLTVWNSTTSEDTTLSQHHYVPQQKPCSSMKKS
jgi:hypothetical protein